jgi:RES domain-containing protein
VTASPALFFQGGKLVAWRLDERRFSPAWDGGEGAFLAGGRWNGPGVRAVYCSTDPSTAILEVAVHKGFESLDLVPHTLTAMTIIDEDAIQVVDPADVPNANWLRPAPPSAGQQTFGDELLRAHKFVLLPSVVAPHSWNLIFVAANAAGAYTLTSQEAFALDTRLNRGR